MYEDHWTGTAADQVAAAEAVGYVHRTGCGEVRELNGVPFVCVGDWSAYTEEAHIHYMRTVEDEQRLAALS